MNCDFDLLEEKLLYYFDTLIQKPQAPKSTDIYIYIYIYIQFKNILENTLLEEVLIKNTYSAHV